MAARKPTFILCFDFDGTLVNPEGTPVFHPGLGQMIQQLRQQGAAWVINTGRSLAQTLQGIGQHGLFMEPDYIVAQECDIYQPGFFSKWKDFGPWNSKARKDHRHFMRDHRKILDAIRHKVESESHAEFLEGDFGELGIVATTNEELDVLCAYIDALAKQSPDLGYHRNGIYLRFSHAGYSKGTALGELSRLLGLDASRCFAGGDNFNDLSMLTPRFARQIACPSNALEPVKTIVRGHGGFVANRPASEGMMEALTHFFRSGA